MDTTQVRTDFPEFTDPAKYPESAVKFWLSVAGLMLNADRWGTLLDVGTELFVAHHLVLAARDAASGAAGGTPGGVQGVVASKTVDKVSVSYDSASVSLTDAGFWNMTSYGIRFLQFARMMGAGGMQVGSGSSAPGIVT